jgi:antitoxin component of MazEF toxin-antitoxin module
MTITIKRVGGSMVVVIPKSLATAMELTEGASLDITTSAGALIMKQHGRRPRRSVAKIVAQINSGSYRRRSRDLADAGPTGKEMS